MTHDTDDTDAAYNTRHFSAAAIAERRSDCDERAAYQAKRHADEIAQEAAYRKSNPWPTDPTALRGHRIGLQEFIRERGD